MWGQPPLACPEVQPKGLSSRAKLDRITRDSGLATQDYFGYQSSTRTSIPVPSNPF